MQDADPLLEFERIEGRIERLESEMGLDNPCGTISINDEFDNLELDDDVTDELNDLKTRLNLKDERITSL